MKQRLSFLLAAVVTGFLLVALGGVAGNVLGASASGGAGASENAAAPAPTEDLVSVMQQREAVYRQMIADANARIEQLQAPPSAEPAQPETPAYPVTPDQAAERAILFAGGTLVQSPELVNVQGTVAYEVVLSGGTFYVNATTGGILMPRVETVTISNSSGRGGEHEEHEHEGDDD